MATVRVTVEVIARDYGLWCRTCALPSGVRTVYATQTGLALSLRTHVCCDDGGCGHDIDPTDPTP